MSPDDLTRRIKQLAGELGFDLVGVCPAVSPAGASRLDEWLDAGYAGQMRYLEERREAYDHPGHVLEGVRSLVMLGMHYQTEQPTESSKGQGRVSRYAWGSNDYHNVIRTRLHSLADTLRAWVPEASTRGVVDTAPLLEREFAQLAGLGWVGKNTMLISPHSGSYFFLAALLTDIELTYDQPHRTDHCGTCTACLDACPTDAFAQPYVLDGSRCVSYLTIELQDHVPDALRAGIGDWLFGCDICQEVCPWNRHAPVSQQPEFAPIDEMNPIELSTLFEVDDAEFRARFRHTPLWRAHRRGLLRNAAIVLGNQRSKSYLAVLVKGLQDEEPIVRAACAWAVGQLQCSDSERALQQAREQEQDVAVLEEIATALRLSDLH